MVAVLLAVAVLVVVVAILVGRVASRLALLPVGASIVVVGSGLRVPMCGDARRRLELVAGAP